MKFTIIKAMLLVPVLYCTRLTAQSDYWNNRLYLGLSLTKTATSILSYGKEPLRSIEPGNTAIIFHPSLRYKVSNGFTLTTEYRHYQSHNKQFRLAGTSYDYIKMKFLKTRTYSDWFFTESGGSIGYGKTRFVFHYSATDGFNNSYHYMDRANISALLVSYAFSGNFQYKRFVLKMEIEPGIRFGPEFKYNTPFPIFFNGNIELQYSLFHNRENSSYNKVSRRY